MSWFEGITAACRGWRGLSKLAFALLYIIVGVLWPGPLRLVWFALAAANLAMLELYRRRHVESAGAEKRP